MPSDAGWQDTAQVEVSADAAAEPARADAVAADVADVDSAGPGDTAKPDTAPATDAQPAEVASDAGADALADADSADTAAVDAAAPTGPQWTVANGCATPVDWESPACAQVACPAGTACMGAGLCLPNVPFVVPTGGTEASWSAVASHESGAWAIAFSAGDVNVGMKVKVQVYAQGGMVGAIPLAVSDAADQLSYAPTLGSLAGGGWLVLWRVDDEAKGIVSFRGRRVTADGLAVDGAVFDLNTTVLGSGDSSGSTNIVRPVMARLRNDNFLAAWPGGAQGSGAKLGIYARLFDATGQPLGGEIDTGTVAAGQQAYSPVIAPLEAGASLLAWELHPAGKAGDPFVQGRPFDAQGKPTALAAALSPKVKVYEALPSVAAWPDGEALVTWKAGDNKFATSAVDVMAQRLSAAVLPVGKGPTKLDSDDTGTYPGNAATALFADGRLAAVWHNQSVGQNHVLLRRYYRKDDVWDCQSTLLDVPMVANQSTAGYLPVVTSFADGRLLAVWTTSLVGSPYVAMGRWLGY